MQASLTCKRRLLSKFFFFFSLRNGADEILCRIDMSAIRPPSLEPDDAKSYERTKYLQELMDQYFKSGAIWEQVRTAMIR